MHICVRKFRKPGWPFKSVAIAYKGARIERLLKVRKICATEDVGSVQCFDGKERQEVLEKFESSCLATTLSVSQPGAGIR